MPIQDVPLALGKALLDGLRPLDRWFVDPFAFERLLLRHGWYAPPNQNYFPQIQAMFDLVSAIPNASDQIDRVSAIVDPPLKEVEVALDAALRVIDDLHTLSLKPPPTGLPFPLDSNEFWSSFPVDVAQTQIALYMAARKPSIYATLCLFGIIESVFVDPNPAIGRFGHFETRLSWQRLKNVFLGPRQVMVDVYKWGAAFDHELFLRAVERAMLAYHAPVRREIPPESALTPYFDPSNPQFDTVRRLLSPFVSDFDSDGVTFEAGLTLLPIPPAGQKGAAPVGLFIGPYFEGAARTEVSLGGQFALVLSGDFATGGTPGIEFRPGQATFTTTPNTGNIDLSIGLVARPSRPFILIGRDDATRLELNDASITLRLVGPSASPDLQLTLATSELRALLEFDTGDGFLSKTFGERGLDSKAAVGITWSMRDGLSFSGSGTLSADFPTSLTIGPVTIHKVGVAIGKSGNDLAASVVVTVSAALGPVTAVVEDIGVELATKALASGEKRGLVGDLDLAFRFRGPSGIGIGIDVGAISGFGFLSLKDRRYTGFLTLKVYGVNVTAFGIIETRLPGGSKGFSFAIVISAEFTAIQLGFGFTLNGVGGIIGINRSIDAAALGRAVRDGSLEHLLFPHNVERDAPQIIHDLASVLPATEGRYVFGPMAKIGWGTPTILEAEVGIILELPGPRLALLGEIHALLPKRDKGLLVLNLSVAGLLDFPAKLFAIDASLHDSRVGSFAITGDMAMRMLWGDTPSFGLAVGGFHPAFQPPPQFPTLRRVSVDLGISGNPSITLQGYFAITSNTAQVGALAELRAGGAGIELYGRVQFDAIFVFSPFSFEAGISAEVRVSFHGHGIGVHLSGVLSGPSPWRVRGEVCVSILFWDACLGFDATFGSAARVEVPAIDPWLGSGTEVTGLQAALQDVRNWTPEPPSGAFSVVSLAESKSDRPFDPLGVAVVRQRVCPLNLQLQRFGTARALANPRFALKSITVNSAGISLQKITFLKEPFAKAQFLDMSDSEKLSAPAFEPFDGAIRVPANDNSIAAGSGEATPIKYKTKILRQPGTKVHTLPAEHLAGMARRGATALFGARQVSAGAYLDPTASARFTVGSELFVVADRLTFKTQAGFGEKASKTEASRALADHVASHPEDRDNLHVVPRYEMGGR